MLVSSLFFASLLSGSALAGPLLESTFGFPVVDTSRLALRAEDDCAGVNLRSRAGLNGAIVGKSDCDRTSLALRMNGGYGYTPGQAYEKVVATTKVSDAKVHLVSNTDANKKQFMPFTCDHVVEINILKHVLSQGACAAADAMKTMTSYTEVDANGTPKTIQVTEGQAKILEIRKVLMRTENLIYIQERIEKEKTYLAQVFNGNKASLGEKRPLDWLAMYDYLTKKTISYSLKTAVMLDGAIQKQFPGQPTGVEKRWVEFLTFSDAIAFKRKKQVEDEIRGCGCAATGSTTPPRPGTPTHARRRHLVDNFSPMPESSLVLASRAQGRPRGAAKSGKRAPGAPSCPLKNAPQKKTVPKSKAKVKAPPAKKPRRPTARPKPRTPAKRKQVAKRPASRARRQPGKPRPRKRVSPKKKPRKVPKPTRKPKGKSRPRRSRGRK